MGAWSDRDHAPRLYKEKIVRLEIMLIQIVVVVVALAGLVRYFSRTTTSAVCCFGALACAFLSIFTRGYFPGMCVLFLIEASISLGVFAGASRQRGD